MKIENPLLGRTEIQEEIPSIKTPTKEEVLKSLAKSQNIDESLIVIKKIHQKYGSNKSIVTAYIYKDKPTLDLFEKINKKKLKQKEKKEQPKAEKPAEEKPKETKEVKDGKEGIQK